MQEKESIISVRHGFTNLSLGSLLGITRQSLVMPNSDPWDRFVHPYLTLRSDSYILGGGLEIPFVFNSLNRNTTDLLHFEAPEIIDGS